MNYKIRKCLIITPGNVTTIYADPESGYQLKTLYVNGNAISGNSFAMPSEAVTVTAEFELVSFSIDEPESPQDGVGGSDVQSPSDTGGATGQTGGSGANNNSEGTGSGDSGSGDVSKANLTPTFIVSGGVVFAGLIAAVVTIAGKKKKASK